MIKQLRHKLTQTKRLSKKTREFTLIMLGATFVSLVALVFARLVDLAIRLNHEWSSQYPLAALVIIPVGFVILAWLTIRLAPNTAGSGIPQVMASIYETNPQKKNILVKLWPTILKIPLTFMALILGASVGREGPTVQVGASVMLAWGKFCDRFKLSKTRLKQNELLTIGAAGGMAAAFNAPLAGIIFAIEELSRITYLRWERYVLFGILASGFILIALEGNNPHFPVFNSSPPAYDVFLWVLVSAIMCGILGGIFAKMLTKGLSFFSPKKLKRYILRHPLYVAGIMGLGVAIIGICFNGDTYGIGYNLSANSLTGQQEYVPGLGAGKFFATIFSYWAGIPGGIFTPSLSIGALAGVALNTLSSQIVISEDVIVLLCMAAFLSAVTQSPLTASVVVMEMTLSISMLFWLLICCIMASFVARQFCPRPFYLNSAIKYVGLLNVIEVKDKDKKNSESKGK
ncbi:chloride channel protein EriC [Neisseriaceae bacterium PsAf]|nr:chloride channel protein EriC [Neisseriaceae bacterium PsAf]